VCRNENFDIYPPGDSGSLQAQKDKSMKDTMTFKGYFSYIQRLKGGNILIVFLAIQIVAVIASLLFPESFRYISQANLRVIFQAIPTLGVIAIGVNLLMIAGEFDLSVGSTFTFSALIMAKLFNAGFPSLLCALTALLVGAVIGWLNGFATVKARVPSFIITLGSMMFWRGIILYVSQSANEAFHPGASFVALFTAAIGPFQVQFVWFVLIAIVAWFLLERHRIGNHFFAVGGNKNAAIALGINSDRIKIFAFTLVGILAAFSGIMSTIRVSSVSPIQGEGLELNAIAACVIGGTAMMGGRGSVLGVFLGAALFYTIQDFLLLLRAPGSYLKLFVGIVIIVATILNEVLKDSSRR
jgi:simple sugar transport system permease protein